MEVGSPNEATHSAVLDHSCVAHILSHLQNPADLAVASLVCKAWKEVATFDHIWRAVYVRCYGFPDPSEAAISFRAQCKRLAALRHPNQQGLLLGRHANSLAYDAESDSLVVGSLSGGRLTLHTLAPVSTLGSAHAHAAVAQTGQPQAAGGPAGLAPRQLLDVPLLVAAPEPGEPAGEGPPLVALACAGGLCAVAAEEGMRVVQVWDLRSGQLLYRLQGHATPVRAVVLCGGICCTASDEVALFWSLAGAAPAGSSSQQQQQGAGGGAARKLGEHEVVPLRWLKTDWRGKLVASTAPPEPVAELGAKVPAAEAGSGVLVALLHSERGTQPAVDVLRACHTGGVQLLQRMMMSHVGCITFSRGLLLMAATSTGRPPVAPGTSLPPWIISLTLLVHAWDGRTGQRYEPLVSPRIPFDASVARGRTPQTHTRLVASEDLLLFSHMVHNVAEAEPGGAVTWQVGGLATGPGVLHYAPPGAPQRPGMRAVEDNERLTLHTVIQDTKGEVVEVVVTPRHLILLTAMRDVWLYSLHE